MVEHELELFGERGRASNPETGGGRCSDLYGGLEGRLERSDRLQPRDDCKHAVRCGTRNSTREIGLECPRKLDGEWSIPGVPGRLRLRFTARGWPLDTVAVVVAGVAGVDVGGIPGVVPSVRFPDDTLASPADALVKLDNVISSTSCCCCCCFTAGRRSPARPQESTTGVAAGAARGVP